MNKKYSILLLIAITGYSFGQKLQWEMVPSPSSTKAINILTSNTQGVLFAATDYSLFRSSDFGSHWENITPINMIDTILALTIRNVLAIDSNKIISSSIYGIFYSSNNGDSWNSSPDIPRNEQILALDADSIGKVYLTTQIGSYISTLSGRLWRFIPPYHESAYATNATIYCCAINKNGYILAQEWNDEYEGTFQLVLRNLNKDTTESSLINETKEHEVLRSHGNSIFYINRKNGTLYCSNNNGKSWHTSMDFKGGPYPSIIIESYDHRLFANVQNAILQSIDNGFHWKKLVVPNDIGRIIDMVIHKDGHLYIGTAKGIFRTTKYIIN